MLFLISSFFLDTPESDMLMMKYRDPATSRARVKTEMKKTGLRYMRNPRMNRPIRATRGWDCVKELTTPETSLIIAGKSITVSKL
jgi:hypothetical protein